MNFLMRKFKLFFFLIGGYSYWNEFTSTHPQIRSDILSTIKVKNKNIFFLSFRGYGKL